MWLCIIYLLYRRVPRKTKKVLLLDWGRGKPQLFHDESPYHIETSLFICSTNQQTGFYKIGTFVMKEVRKVIK